jgi:hypothetical protein
MTDRSKWAIVLVFVGTITIMGFSLLGRHVFGSSDKITDFESCSRAENHVIIETYPTQCQVGGQVFYQH